jgi:diaminohydroxyphosphoribosylaminopyrimidine deaminase/5-amino-6-(5-phosphoribosylamino)uracil reductase
MMSGPEQFAGQARQSLRQGAADTANMALAIALGRRGLGNCWPNPAVGSVIVDTAGRIVSYGWTGPGGRPHAEASALAGAGPAARGATLYTTLEPCAHWGKTPPCTDAIINAGIVRVVYGLIDADPRVAGKGIKTLEAHGIETVPGPMPQEARWLTLGHDLRLTKRRPFIQLKLAVDGAGLIPAGGGGVPVWVSSNEARAQGHLLRAQADAILIGYGTLLADDPDLTCRLPGMTWQSPLRVVLSTDGRLSRHAKMLRNLSTAPVWVVSAAGIADDRKTRLEELGTSVITVPKNDQGRLNLHAVMRALADRGITRLLVEGGPSLEANLMKEGLADEVIIFQARNELRGATIMPFAPAGLESVTDDPAYRLFDRQLIGTDRIWIYRKVDVWQG